MAAVKFRGLDAGTGLARWGLAAVAIGIVVGGTVPAAVSGLAAVVEANPQALVWLFERLFAWLSYIAVAGSVIYGLLLSTKILDAIAHRPISFSLHQDLAAFGLGLAAIHGMLLTAWSAAGIFGPVLVNYIREYNVTHGVPKAQAYNTTMYIMAGLLVVGVLCNFLIKAVHYRFHMKSEQEAGRAQAGIATAGEPVGA